MPIRLPHRVMAAVRSFLRRRTADRELDAELQFHLEQMAAHEAAARHEPSAAQDASRQDAQRSAWRQFGGFDQVKEACRDMRPLRPVEHFFQDLRFGARLLARTPTFAAVAILSLTLGIGANSAIYSVINGILVRTLPVDEPEQLYIVEIAQRTDVTQLLSFPVVERARELVAGRAELGAQSTTVPMQIGVAAASNAPEHGHVQLVSGDYFSVLRQRAQVGRLLGPDDNRALGQHPVAVLSDAYWSRRFGRAPTVLGSEVVINGASMTVVGVAAPRFFGATVGQRSPDVWAPIMMQAQLRFAGNVSSTGGDTGHPWPSQRQLSWLNVLARVPSGGLPAVTDAMTLAVRRELALDADADDGERDARLSASRVVLTPGSGGFSPARTQAAAPLALLVAMVVLLLAVASANLASLLLARASNRHREMAIRLSIGAGRGRLIRQLLTESLLLALVGGALGLLIADWTLNAVAGQSAQLNGVDLRPDWRVIALTSAVSIATGLLFGLLPAMRGTQVALSETLKAQTAGAIGAHGRQGGRVPVGKVLIAAQMAFSLLLLVIATLFARSLYSLGRVDVGVDHERLVVARVDALMAGYGTSELAALHHRVLDRISAVPGVSAASMSANGLFGASRTVIGFEAQGYTRGRNERLVTDQEIVTNEYFQTVGLTIRRGRRFGPEDTASTRKVSIINETMARRFFKNEDPIGKRWGFDTAFDRNAFEIVGVVADAHYTSVKEASPNMVYLPASQGEPYLRSLEVRTVGPPALLVAAIRDTLREVEPRLPIMFISTLDARIAKSMGQERYLTLAALAFGSVALGLACLGLYGTISYAVARRTAEIGVRMALGASRAAVLWVVMREALVLVLAGLLAGLPLAFLAARALSTLLFGITPADPAAYTAAGAVLVLVGAAAAYLPARRASRLDPMLALRRD